MTRLALRSPSLEGRGTGPRSDHDLLVGSDLDQKLEDWLVCHLDDTNTTSQPSLLESFLADMPLKRRGGGSGAPTATSWSRLAVRKDRNVVVVRLTSKHLLREDDLRETSEELSAVAAAGYSRIVVNFSGVERLSSQFVAALAVAARKSRASGGELRICGLRPELATLFEITRLAGPIAIFPDEAAAHAAPWPISCGPRPLPVSILQALRENGVVETLQATHAAQSAVRAAHDPLASTPPRSLWLVVESGRHAGKRIPVRSGPFVIGRDDACQLRIRGATISRRHAMIEVKAHSPILLDLQTTNGTLLNGRPIHGESRPLHAGDRIQIGPVVMRVAFGSKQEDEFAEDLVEAWSREESDPGADDATSLDIDTVGTILVETIQDVLVIHPRLGALEDDETISRVREELNTRLGQNEAGVHLVVDLDQVPSMSSRALGMLLALALRLERRGGRLRLCRANARVSAMLDAIRLPLLVELMPTLDDAVISSWE